MKQFYNILLMCSFLLFIALVGCSPRLALHEATIDEMADRPLAKGDSNFVFTAGDFYERVKIAPMMMNGGTYDAEQANHLLDSILLDTLASILAYSTPLENDYLSKKLFKKQYYDFLVDQYWTETLYKKTTTDSMEAVQFYNDHPELFSVDEQVNLYHILCSPYGLTIGNDSAYYKQFTREELWVKTKEYADNLVRLLDFGEAFQNVAYSYSHDVTSASKGGFIGWTPRGIYLDPFDSVAFSLKPFEYSQPYQDKDGWHIVYIDAYQPAGPVPIDSPSVYISAVQTVLTDKSNKEVERRRDSLKAAINLIYNEELLDTNIYYVDDSVWMAVVNDIDTVDARDAKMLEEGYRMKYDVDNTTPEMKRSLLIDAAEIYNQAQTAREAGIEELPHVKMKRDSLYYLRAKMLIQKDQYDYNWSPTLEQMEAYYQRNISDYVVPKPVKVEILKVRDSTFAEFLKGQVESGFDIPEVIREHNGTGDQRASSLGPMYVSDEDLEMKLRVVTNRTNVGSVTPIVRTEDGYYSFVKVHDRKDSREFYRAQGEIKVKLQRQHAKEVWGKYRAEIYEKMNIRLPVKLSSLQLGNFHVRNAPKE